MEPRLLILETSCQVGQVAVAAGAKILGSRRLDEARRHARDLVPAMRDSLAGQGWRARDLNAVIVSRGPGSYTGLRVGIMTAKTLAYATGCTLLAVDTFAAVAYQVPEQAQTVDVLADAQQDKVYVQRFGRVSGVVGAQGPLIIRPFNDWLVALESDVFVSGPGVRTFEAKLGGRLLVEPCLREPLAESLLQLGLERFQRGERDDLWKLEPLYLRPSAAEEKWTAKRM